MPSPSMSAMVRVSPGATRMYGLTFQPVPRSRAAFFRDAFLDGNAASHALCAVGFSGLIERVSALRDLYMESYTLHASLALIAYDTRFG
jgi:hypothetical protein